MEQMESIGDALIKSLFGSFDTDVTTYCDAAVDEAYAYCIQEFKRACEKAGITWKKSWEAILYE